MRGLVLVTGAAGFVGAAVARHLLAEGYQVRTLIRPTSLRGNLKGLDAEIVTGDLRDRQAVEKAVAGSEAVFHVAADYRLWARNPADIYDSNLRGTRFLMEASLAAGVRRVVYTSSVATLGLLPGGTPADEATQVGLGDMVGHYKRSKYLAEMMVREMVRQRGLDAVIVNPSTPVGPGDIKPTPTGRMIAEAVAGRTPAYVETGLNIVHVDDVARGHVLALEKGVAGERYILGSENLNLREIFAVIAKLSGTKPPRVRLPHGLVMPVAQLAELAARLGLTSDPFVTVEGIKLARKYMFFSIEKAQRELGFSPRPAYEALADAVAWYKAHPVAL